MYQEIWRQSFNARFTLRDCAPLAHGRPTNMARAADPQPISVSLKQAVKPSHSESVFLLLNSLEVNRISQPRLNMTGGARCL